MRARLQKSVPDAGEEPALYLARVVGQLAEQRLLGEVAQAGVRDVGDDHVLPRREAELAAPVHLGQARQLEELVAGDAAHRAS